MQAENEKLDNEQPSASLPLPHLHTETIRYLLTKDFMTKFTFLLLQI